VLRAWTAPSNPDDCDVNNCEAYLELRGAPARRRTAPPAGKVKMFPRSGPRTDGSCAEGPRVERFDD
jgi:hypothetical protein